MTASVYGVSSGSVQFFPKLDVMVAQPNVNKQKATELYDHVF